MKKDDRQSSRKEVSLSEKIRTGMINQNDIHEELSSEFATLGERKKAMIDLYHSTKKKGNDEKLQP
ncbi:MAG: hypothetical protein ABS920_08720 [Sporosarcina sp.]